MSKYGVNSVGAQQLRQLAANIVKISNDMEECNKKLSNTVLSLGDDLGIYERQILELVNGVNRSQIKAREPVNALINKARAQADEIDELC